MSSETMGHDAVEAEGLADWTKLVSALHARFATGDFATGLRLVNAIGGEAEAMNHHPDLDLRYPHVDVKLMSHDAGGVTDRDIRLARRISELAAAEGVSADRSAVTLVELALDSVDWRAIRPFWAAVLGLPEGGDDDHWVEDPAGSVPDLWFQGTDAHDEPRQRFHYDVWVAPDVAPGRIAAALAAGGVLVSDDEAPAFTVLADVQGNKACVCTSEGRN